MGDKYLRRLLVVGMTSLVRRAKYKPKAVDPWLADMLSRKPARVVTVALANKTARVIWAIMARGGTYHAKTRWQSPDAKDNQQKLRSLPLWNHTD
jgi:transposase